MKVVRLINLHAKSKSKESGGESGGELKVSEEEAKRSGPSFICLFFVLFSLDRFKI